MKVETYKSYSDMSRAAAELVIKQVKQKPDSLICVPSGESPKGMLAELVKAVQQDEVDLKDCNFIALDEWVGMGKENEGSCAHFIYEHLITPAHIDPDKVKFFDALSADLDDACETMNSYIKETGPIDIMIVGIGMNGHIGLNEPGTDFNVYAHHSALDSVTVNVGQKYFKQETALTEGITLGLKHLQEAKVPVLIASGSKKAGIIAQSIKGDVTTAVPASIFQTLPSALILLDEEAAAEL